jgi:A/G-specific adenine glycosylase
VSAYCKAAENGTASQLPKKAPKKARRVEEKTVFVLKREDTVALRKREDNGLLAGLWEFPNVEHKLEESSVYEHLGAHGLTVTGWKKQLIAKHIFTHIEWHMTGYVLAVKGEDNLGLTWVSAEEFSRYAIPSAFAKFTKEVSEIL